MAIQYHSRMTAILHNMKGRMIDMLSNGCVVAKLFMSMQSMAEAAIQGE